MRLLPGLAAAAVALAGCGGDGGGTSEPPTPLPRQVASQLASRSDAVADLLDAGDACGARAEAEELQRQTLAAVNGGRVPPRYQEELTAAVGALLAAIECVEAPPPAPPASEEDDDDEEDDEDGDDDEDERDEEKEKEKEKDEKEKPGKGKGRENAPGRDRG